MANRAQIEAMYAWLFYAAASSAKKHATGSLVGLRDLVSEAQWSAISGQHRCQCGKIFNAKAHAAGLDDMNTKNRRGQLYRVQ